MPSTYTTNLGIEKIATGEQSGTWGNTTNTNLDLIDQAVNGIAAITLAAAGSSGSPNSLIISDGAVSDGRNKFIEYVDGGDLGATAYVQLVPNDAEKIVIIRNSLSGSQNLIIFQGTYNASNDFEIPNGKEVVLKFSGTGTGATVTQVFNDLSVAGITAATATLTTADINGGTIDGAAIGGSSATVGTFTTLTATTLGGALNANNENITNVDIDSGAIDNTTIGAAGAAAGTFTTLSATTLGSSLDANSQAITNVDINSGNIDGTTIGGASAAVGTFTTLNATTLTATTLGGALDANNENITNVDIDSGAIDGTTIGGASAAVGTFTTLNATTVDLGNWTITESAGVLYFATSGTDTMKLDASGSLTVIGDVTAYGTM